MKLKSLIYFLVLNSSFKIINGGRKNSHGTYLKIKSIDFKPSEYALKYYLHNNWTIELKTFKRIYQFVGFDFTLKVPINAAYVSCFKKKII